MSIPNKSRRTNWKWKCFASPITSKQHAYLRFLNHHMFLCIITLGKFALMSVVEGRRVAVVVSYLVGNPKVDSHSSPFGLGIQILPIQTNKHSRKTQSGWPFHCIQVAGSNPPKTTTTKKNKTKLLRWSWRMSFAFGRGFKSLQHNKQTTQTNLYERSIGL